MNETKYYCDFCKKEVEYKKKIQIAFSLYGNDGFENTTGEYTSINADTEYKSKLDMCPECIKKFGIKPLDKELSRPKDNEKINEWQKETLNLVEKLFRQFYSD